MDRTPRTKNRLPHLGSLGKRLTRHYSFTKPGKTISSFMEKKWAPIVKFMSALCQLGQTQNFYLHLEASSTTKNFVLEVNHNCKRKSKIGLTVDLIATHQQEIHVERTEQFGPAEKSDFFSTLFFLFIHLPKKNRIVGTFRIGRKVVLEMHRLQSSYGPITNLIQEQVGDKNPEVCKQFLRHGVRDNMITDYFQPVLNAF